MKAVAVNSFNTLPLVMDLPEPAVKEGSIKIKLAAAGLNPFDWKMTDGIMKDDMAHVFPLIMGVDGAGVVTEIGAGVTRFKVGDKIYGQMLHEPVGEGSYAEYVVVPETKVLAIAPETISLAEAAAAPTAGMTGLQLLTKAGLQSGQSVLLIGATGGVGSFTIQLANAKGIRVIATVSSPAAAERMIALGAAATVNYKESSIEEQVHNLYPDGVDVLIDLVSNKEDFHKMTTLVKPEGTVLTTQFVADKETLKAQYLHGGNFETKGSPASLDELRKAIDTGEIKIPIERKISLEQAPAAIAESRERKSRGKTIILIEAEG
ncbi:zinc-binding dehydrogenase [Chitinophaga sp. SYP-B3965]|uniref:NADP-dependent oxidoreductase n=1 Tax=Chitinophaga sp. SYP-B3965 TaxID=2663120 RepID=UPI001299E0DB|nr:NADP-dependent oxidoreductase [Chitinophaga sp. SYP-B3965]MRG44488.1 zinc-binding dehydrogenase [Chitinophaga sp. SYP-B3965]